MFVVVLCVVNLPDHPEIAVASVFDILDQALVLQVVLPVVAVVVVARVVRRHLALQGVTWQLRRARRRLL